MVNIVRTKLENKLDKPIIFYIAGSRITLNPGTPVILDGDVFSQETRQEGNTEGLLINIYNGNIELTLICDDTFINKIERESVVILPKRAQVHLKKPVVVEEPSKVSETKPVESKPVEVNVQPKEETKPVEAPVEVKKDKQEDIKVNDSLEGVVIEDTKAKSKPKKVTKL